MAIHVILSLLLMIGEGCKGKHNYKAHNIYLMLTVLLIVPLYKSINLEWNYFPNLRGGGIDLDTTKFELGYIIRNSKPY